MLDLIMEDILDTDSYKPSQWLQYPPGMEGMFSYFESRGGEFVESVSFGLQYLLNRHFSKPVTVEGVEYVAKFLAEHGEPFNKEGWMYIAKDLGGKLPIRIRAVPEGLVVPVKNILMSVESTSKVVPWVPGWFETSLSRIWYPTTVATLSRECKKIINSWLERTTDVPLNHLAFKLHDFGSRGASSRETAMIGGAAHLLSFMGSDTLAGVWMMNNYYNKGKMSGWSIGATEHSTITSWGRKDEYMAYENFLEKFKGKLAACVSDSYNVWDVIENGWCDKFLPKIIADGTMLVIRLDSGVPVHSVVRAFKLIESKIGSTPNGKGFKVLNHGIRLIQGDGIDIGEIGNILETVCGLGFSAENIAFGMGGGLLQKVNRDTMKFAYKCSSVTINGVERDVFKDPIDDAGKKSKAGRLKLILADGSYKTVRQSEPGDDVLETVFENGEIFSNNNLPEMLARAKL